MGNKHCDFIGELREYFKKRDEVLMAYLFGSYAKGDRRPESDCDIAVYLKTKDGRVEYESDAEYPSENEIWFDIEEITGVDTDFVVLNRIPATLADEILRTGKEIVIKDRALWLDYMLPITMIAEDFREFAKDFRNIKERSASLTEQDKHSLLKKIDFLKGELEETECFKKLEFSIYQADRKERRNIERWTENIINAAIDISKIILASEKRNIPDRYKDTLLSLGLLIGLDEAQAKRFSGFARLRNFLAHEYLDFRFSEIKKFINEGESIFKVLLAFTEKLLRNGDCPSPLKKD